MRLRERKKRLLAPLLMLAALLLAFFVGVRVGYGKGYDTRLANIHASSFEQGYSEGRLSAGAAAELPTRGMPDELPAAETVYVTAHGKKYHREGCRYLTSDPTALSAAAAAAAGYDPCNKCKP